MNKLAVIATLAVVALVPQVAEAQRPPAKTPNWTMTDQDLLDLLKFRTTTLAKLAVGLKEMGGSLKPKQGTRALTILKTTNNKIATILDNPKFSEAKKKQQVILTQNEGVFKMVGVLGQEAKTLKNAFKSLEGAAFETKLKSLAGPKFAPMQSKLLSADRMGGNAEPFNAWEAIGAV